MRLKAEQLGDRVQREEAGVLEEPFSGQGEVSSTR